MKKVFVIEDEPVARNVLVRMLSTYFPDLEIIGTADTVDAAVEFLQSHSPDILFMDIQLSDGESFQIFSRVQVTGHVVMTTAYDSYAVKAFETGSIDYLVKPVDLPSLKRAVERCLRTEPVPFDLGRTMMAITSAPVYQDTLIVHYQDHIVSVKDGDILYFFVSAGDSRVAVKSGAVYPVEASLDALLTQLDPERFFRISRKTIVAKEAVSSVARLLGGRLRVQLSSLPASLESSADLTVSRARVDAFLQWLSR